MGVELVWEDEAARLDGETSGRGYAQTRRRPGGHAPLRAVPPLPSLPFWAAAWAALVVFFQAEGGIRDVAVTGVQTCALPISKDGENLRHAPGPLLPGTYPRARR